MFHFTFKIHGLFDLESCRIAKVLECRNIFYTTFSIQQLRPEATNLPAVAHHHWIADQLHYLFINSRSVAFGPAFCLKPFNLCMHFVFFHFLHKYLDKIKSSWRQRPGVDNLFEVKKRQNEKEKKLFIFAWFIHLVRSIEYDFIASQDAPRRMQSIMYVFGVQSNSVILQFRQTNNFPSIWYR